MPVYVSTACLPGKIPLAQRLDELARVGLFHVELGAGVAVNSDELEAWLEQTKQNLLIHNYFPPPREEFVLNLASGDDNILLQSRSLVTEALSLARRLGAPYYSVHAGFVTEPTAFGGTSFVFPAPVCSSEAIRAMNRFVASLKGILGHACDIGVHLLVENNLCSPGLSGKLLLQTAEECRALFRMLPQQQLGLLLDTGHLNVTARTLDFDPLAFVDQVAPYVRAMHIHDNDGLLDTHEPIRPASWALSVLKRPEFVGLPVVIEARFENAAHLRRHVDWLTEELGYE